MFFTNQKIPISSFSIKWKINTHNFICVLFSCQPKKCLVKKEKLQFDLQFLYTSKKVSSPPHGLLASGHVPLPGASWLQSVRKLLPEIMIVELLLVCVVRLWFWLILEYSRSLAPLFHSEWLISTSYNYSAARSPNRCCRDDPSGFLRLKTHRTNLTRYSITSITPR